MTTNNNSGESNEPQSQDQTSLNENSGSQSSVDIQSRLAQILGDDPLVNQAEADEADSNQSEVQQTEGETPQEDTTPDDNGDKALSQSEENENEDVSRGVQKRIDKLTALRKTAEERAEALQAELDSYKSKVDELEKKVSDFLDCDRVLTLNSGTSALHATLLAYNIHQSDEIIVPSFSFIATANAVLFVNSKPVFADIEPVTFGLDPQSVTNQISSKTKAIVPMDYGGLSCKINEIKTIADNKNIHLIEDAAEALGANVNGKKVWTGKQYSGGLGGAASTPIAKPSDSPSPTKTTNRKPTAKLRWV